MEKLITIQEAYKCLNSDEILKTGEDCDFFAYREVIREVLGRDNY